VRFESVEMHCFILNVNIFLALVQTLVKINAPRLIAHWVKLKILMVLGVNTFHKEIDMALFLKTCVFVCKLVHILPKVYVFGEVLGTCLIFLWRPFVNFNKKNLML
jgi:hypothetical protein